jgi:prepilin-type N-terminal cleavage/methylation domain-containing protein/prepilin-type processing-associated H-X9-DG protein
MPSSTRPARLPSARHAAGFSLVEMLVVLAVIAILAGLVTPVVTTALARGKSTECQNNLKQWGMALDMYLDEHGSVFPADGSAAAAEVADLWFNALPPYVNQPTFAQLKEAGKVRVPGTGKSLYICPASPVEGAMLMAYNAGSQAAFYSSYACNQWLAGKRLGQMVDSAITVSFIDSPNHNLGYTTGADMLADALRQGFRHNHRANVRFVDGHVRAVRKVDLARVRWDNTEETP